MKKQLVFVIDDDLFFQKIIKYSLQKLGFEHIECYSSGQEALDNFYRKPDIVFLDYYLDDMEGMQILKKIKNIIPDTYVIMISSQDNVDIAVSLIQCGAFDYIVKSDEPDKKIAKALQEIQEMEQMEVKHDAFK